MRTAAFHSAVLAFAAAALSACAQQGRAPPAFVKTPADLRPAPGRYAAMLTTTQVTLTSSASIMWLCPSPKIVVDASGTYEDALHDALRRSLGDVTFVSTVLNPAQLRQQGFAAEVVVARGRGRSSFAQSTGAADVSLSATVTVQGRDGVVARKVISGQGRSRATMRLCTAVTDAIGSSASDAIAVLARDSALYITGVLGHGEERVAEVLPPPPSKPNIPVKRKTKAPDKPHFAAARPAAKPPAASTPQSPPPADAGNVGAENVSAVNAFIRGTDAAAGRNGPRDDVAAMKWFRISAEQGYAPAENNLGFFYAEGRGAARDDAEAVRWYKRAADQKYPPAETSLGMMYAQGRGVKQSDLDALALYSAAANQGYPQAKANLAEMYREGRGVAKDDMTAGFLLASVRDRPMLGSGIYVEPYVDPEKFYDR